MTPAARVQAAIEILTQLNATAFPADRFLRDWFRARHFMGSKDRAAVAERVYDILRHRASYARRMGEEDPRQLAIASLLREGKAFDEVESLFSAGAYGPEPLSEKEKRAMQAPQRPPPLAIACEFPEWLQPELLRAFGPDLELEMQAMNARAPVDLRVNTLRSTRQSLMIGLDSLGIPCAPTPFAPHGIRIASAESLSRLQHTDFFQTGAFEFQDESSQIAAALAAPKPGERVLDLAAGAGGKALAMAAAMKNRGDIIAYDSEPARLKQLGPRARRAGARIIKAANHLDEIGSEKSFDLVFVDAPCSGSGAWRRTPESKWRLTPEKLAGYRNVQASLLNRGAGFVREGGRLVYATCSLLPCENSDAIDAFLERNAQFQRCSAAAIWQNLAPSGDAPNLPPGITENFNASPRKTGTDGFFACIMMAV